MSDIFEQIRDAFAKHGLERTVEEIKTNKYVEYLFCVLDLPFERREHILEMVKEDLLREDPPLEAIEAYLAAIEVILNYQRG